MKQKLYFFCQNLFHEKLFGEWKELIVQWHERDERRPKISEIFNFNLAKEWKGLCEDSFTSHSLMHTGMCLVCDIKNNFNFQNGLSNREAILFHQNKLQKKSKTVKQQQQKWKSFDSCCECENIFFLARKINYLNTLLCTIALDILAAASTWCCMMMIS